MKKIPILSVFAALSAFASPVIPGEFTDPSNIRKATESLPGDWYVAPEHLKFPYISTYHVVPTLTTKDRVEIPFYVTDWDHSKVRFLDDSFRFDVHSSSMRSRKGSTGSACGRRTRRGASRTASGSAFASFPRAVLRSPKGGPTG